MNDAFTEALNSELLDLVVWLCQNLEKDMWTFQGKLTGAVMLSLVQQLSLKLENDTNLKLNWISLALLSLKKSDETISNHIPNILKMAHQNIEVAYDSLNPTSQNQANMILLLIKQVL